MTGGPTRAPGTAAVGRRGAVVAPHHLATGAGLRILRAGGSAVDAAIATNAVLGVVMPGACGIGGDAFWLVWDPVAGEQVALNGSGRAPAAIDVDRLRARGLAALPDRGPDTVTVPGVVRSWAAAHSRWGRLLRDDVLGPAIELARDGFPATEELAEAVEDSVAVASATLERSVTATFERVFRPAGAPLRPGQIVRLPALAATMEILAREGWDAFYEGGLAVRQVRALAAVGSPILEADYVAQDAVWGTPISTTYRGVRLTTHGPNSSGIVALETLRILERFEPPGPSAFGPHGVTDPRWTHLGIEAAKLAAADRDRFLGDPATTGTTVEWLLDDDRIRRLAATIDPGRAARPPIATQPPGGGTVFLGAVDAEGMAVSLIQSTYYGFGSGIVDPETGILFHNRGTAFSLVPGHPNELAPGKRPLHTLLPAMLFRGGVPAPWLVVGSMGADAQPQIHAQFVSAVVDGGVPIETAVAAPRWFVAAPERFAPPMEVVIEPRVPPSVVGALEAMGHPIVRAEPWDRIVGQQHAIELVEGGPAAAEGSLRATTDPRSDGSPATW